MLLHFSLQRMFLVIVLVTVVDCVLTESHFASDSARISSWISQPLFSLGLFGVVTTEIVIFLSLLFFLKQASRLLASFSFISLRNYLLHSYLNLPILQLMFVTEMNRSKESEPQEEGSRAVLIGSKRQLILIVRIVISLIYKRTLVMEIVWIK